MSDRFYFQQAGGGRQSILWRDTELLDEVRLVTDAISKRGAQMVARMARALVPEKTGDLRRTIHTEKSKFVDGGYLVVAGGEKEYYAAFVELGTPGTIARVRNKGFDKSKKRGAGNWKLTATRRKKVGSNPFMRPALHHNKRKIFGLYRDALK
ncbi:MAG: HK97 gp10 family phage protein [FCB group bacterium]|nr:HK97 gp10 family phage protein [FCB group bacterium]